MCYGVRCNLANSSGEFTCILHGKVLGLETKPKPGGNDFGGLISAELVFSGLLKPASYRMVLASSASSLSIPYKWTSSSSRFELPKDVLSGELFTTDMRGIQERIDAIDLRFDPWYPKPKALASLYTSHSAGIEETQVTEVDVCLLLIREELVGDFTDYEGLLLQRNLSGAYTRLGIFKLWHNLNKIRPTDRGHTADGVAIPSEIAEWLTSGTEQVITLV